jgi:Mycothiol maleylpyruvate isomerase N-terminal domain
MEAPPVQASYLPFAQTLRAGGFSEPAEGWNAAQVGAHISMSNELFSELADQIRAGGQPSFDNAAVSDPAALTAHAEAHGGLDGLADAIEASAARLERAYGSLSPEERDRPVPTRIWHEGQIVRDSPMSIGELILGNGDFHLAMHMEQLQALLPDSAHAAP